MLNNNNTVLIKSHYSHLTSSDRGLFRLTEMKAKFIRFITKMLNIIKYGINNGFVEGYNNKIKVIKRVSYGIRKYERLRKLIHLRTA